MTKAALPAVSEVETDKLEEFKKSDKVVLVAYLAEDDKKNLDVFSETANALRENYLFGRVKDADMAKADGVKQPALVLYKDFDEGKNTFDGKFDKEAITEFAKKAATPLVGEFGPDTYQGYMDVSAFSIPRVLYLDSSTDIRLGWHPSGLYFRRHSRGA